MWDGPLAVKGIVTADDAARALDVGADAVVVSNHGGRQLDRLAASVEALPLVADRVGGRMEVLLDSGIRTGSDIAAALALGATGCLVGRPYLYGLMAGGEAGVTRSIEIYASELRRAMRLLGTPSVAMIDGSRARLRDH